jgi:phage tail-like protein
VTAGTQSVSDSAQRPRERTAPPSASARAYLRNGLPAVYRETWETAGRSDTGNDLESPFAMRFLKALEEVLDPIITILDCLPAHLDPKLAPAEALHLMALWLGLPYEEHLSRTKQQRLVENALQISRLRGTANGLQLLLELMFGDPDRPHEPLFVVEDGGYCAVGSAPPADPAGRPESGTFVVHWTRPIDDDDLASVKRVIEREKPVNTRCVYQPPEPSRQQVRAEVKA